MYQSAEYKRSRMAYIWECTFEYFVSMLFTETFLAKILTSIGVSDAVTGVISSISSLALLFQFGSVFLMRRVVNTKRTAILFHTTSQVFFLFLYLIPFLPFAAAYKSVLFVVCILAAYFGNYLVTNMIFRWGNSFVEPDHRARFGANKEMISLASGMVVSLFLGYMTDFFAERWGEEASFIFAAVMIVIFSLSDFICILLIKNDIREKVPAEQMTPLREVLRNTLGKRDFISVIALSCVWNFGTRMTIGFLGTYQIGELGMSMTQVQVIMTVGNLGRFIFSKPFGVYSDKHSYIKGIELGFAVAGLGFLTIVFTVPGTRWLMILYFLLYYISLAGTNQNLLNVSYSYVDAKYFVEATAIRNCFGGICGFLGSLVGGKILSDIQARGNTLFGIHLYAQQFLAFLSFLFTLAAFLLARFVVGKQKNLAQ